MIGQRNSILSLRMLSSASRQSASDGRFGTASVLVLPEDFLGLGEGTITPAENGSEKATILRALNAEGKVPRKADGQPYSAEELGRFDVNTLRILRANIPATVPIARRAAKPDTTTKGAGGLTGLARAIAEHQAGR